MLLGPHHVNLTHPDVIVFVVLLRTACCMGVVDAGSYHALCDFRSLLRVVCDSTQRYVPSCVALWRTCACCSLLT